MVSETTLPLKLHSKYPGLLQYKWVYCGTVLQIPDVAVSIWTLPDASYLLSGYAYGGIEWYRIYSKPSKYLLHVHTMYLDLDAINPIITKALGNSQPKPPLSQWPCKARTRLVRYLMRWEPGAMRKHRALLKRSNLHPILSPLWET